MKFNRTSWVALVVAASALLAGCERPPVDTVQTGFRGTGMELVYNPRTLADNLDIHKAPQIHWFQSHSQPCDKHAVHTSQSNLIYTHIKRHFNLTATQAT